MAIRPKTKTKTEEATALLEKGERTRAVRVLQETSELKSGSYTNRVDWMNAQLILAEHYRELGYEAEAREIDVAGEHDPVVRLEEHIVVVGVSRRVETLELDTTGVDHVAFIEVPVGGDLFDSRVLDQLEPGGGVLARTYPYKGIEGGVFSGSQSHCLFGGR